MNRELVEAFDSGACINITKSRGKYHRLQVVIHGDRDLLNELQEQTRLGKVYSDGWHIESAQAEQLLRNVAPYVERKAEHVDIVLEFRTTYAGKGGAGELSGTIQDERDKYMRELSTLNRGR